MSRHKKALDGRNAHIFTLRAIIVVLGVCLFGAIQGWKAAPEHIKIDIPPDLRSGSTRLIGERHPFNVYSFGYYIFQQLNNWPVSGAKDYKKRIRELSCYFTPEYKAWLDRDYERRFVKNELNRTRATQEMPGRPYKPNRIYKESGDSWVAYYDLNVKETFHGERVKDLFARYPVRVVRWDVDPECNLWGLALDGFYGSPTRLEDHKQGDSEHSDKLAGR